RHRARRVAGRAARSRGAAAHDARGARRPPPRGEGACPGARVGPTPGCAALFLAGGVPAFERPGDYLAPASSSPGGRMMPVHGSYRRLGIYPPATPTGSQCLPAVGAAWGLRMVGIGRIVLCTIGDAATRQGEFFEAVAQAVQERL